jgi:hypothetical protein
MTSTVDERKYRSCKIVKVASPDAEIHVLVSAI